MKLFVVAAKELLLLRRDRAGLVVLFLMPAILVVIITLVQENVMALTGQKPTTMLLLDMDQEQLGNIIRQRLESLNIALTSWSTTEHTREDLVTAVHSGDYQFGLIIPQGTSAALQEKARQIAGAAGSTQQPVTDDPVQLSMVIDPTLLPSLRNGVTAQLDMAAELLSLQYTMAWIQRSLAEGVPSSTDLTPPPPQQAETTSQQNNPAQPLLTFTETSTLQEQQLPAYSPTQQNVPAWALFGMFFTAIPIAGSILQERNSGIMARLVSSPVSQASFQLGKVAAYIGICLSQFMVICLIGMYLFPYIGLTPFSLGEQPLAALLVVLCSGLAACGYGLLLGNLCSTYEQASTVGATTVVAAAALGGIMVPVYAMPSTMQQVSQLSPLNWGLTAFQNLLVRGNPLTAVAEDLGKLVAFFILSSFLSWLISSRKRLR
ncbi:ABC transporter permease [Desulfogranum japonicum]|uniref:ABC transporter permease n=1 Tax=Desulfogranum japonicum TaxID=231447 RepID=UPI00042269E6|nr:ABC transporter permease [Desulfogranum japonicum]